MILWKDIARWFREWREARRINAIAEAEYREWQQGEAAEALRKALEKKNDET